MLKKESSLRRRKAFIEPATNRVGVINALDKPAARWWLLILLFILIMAIPSSCHWRLPDWGEPIAAPAREQSQKTDELHPKTADQEDPRGTSTKR